MTDTKNSNPAGAQDLNEKVKATAASATDEAKARAKDVADTVASDAARYADEGQRCRRERSQRRGQRIAHCRRRTAQRVATRTHL